MNSIQCNSPHELSYSNGFKRLPFEILLILQTIVLGTYNSCQSDIVSSNCKGISNYFYLVVWRVFSLICKCFLSDTSENKPTI